MTLLEVIQKHHWLSIEAELIRLYPDQARQISAYQGVYEQLLQLTPETSDIVIRLTEIVDEDEVYVEVDGYCTDGHNDENSHSDALGLDFSPWEQWLGMQVNEHAFKEFTELEILAHCLYEMTFISFDQEEIKNEMDNLKKTIDEYEQMSPEERKRNTTSLEDFMKELGEEE